MARFRDNSRRIIVEPIYGADGLKVERVRRFDEARVLPEVEVWRAWSFRVTLAGTRFVRYGERTYALAPSTILWSSPIGAPVKTYALAGTRSDTVTLTFSSAGWKQRIQEQTNFDANNADLLRSYPSHSILALQSAPPQVLHVLRRLVAAREAHAVSSLVLSNFCSLLLHLIGDLPFNVCAARHDHDQRVRIEGAQARLLETVARPLNLETLAGELNVSLRQLQRDFTALTGMSPVRYRNVIRLSEANTLLAESSLPIAEIAANLDYASVAHFSAAFRQMYHCSPREVRESAHKGADDGDGIDPLHSSVDLEPATLT